MPEERKKHSVIMDGRKKTEITGVTDVISFDEDCIVLDTTEGAMVLRGRDLHINSIDLDKGELSADGEFAGLTYEDSPVQKRSVFAKIFK